MEINLQKTEANDKELLEMILQFFYENKYSESAKLLESKANIIYDQNEIQQLKYLLKQHKFDESIKFLEGSNFENIQKAEVLKILKSRRYLEMIREGLNKEALDYLRTELTPLFHDRSMLNKFSVMLFQKDKENIEKHLKNNFHELCYDDLLIRRVQSLLCLSLDSNGNRILPNSRLETLINTYLDITKNTMNVDSESRFGLSSNYIIEKHDDEVWHLELSNNAKLFATCSRNGMISIFRIEHDEEHTSYAKIECVSYFLAHKKYLTCMQWSKSDKFLLTSSADKSIKLWEPFEGKCIKTFLIHTDIVTCVRWLSEETFVSGSIDKKMIICTIGNRVVCSETFTRIRRVLVSNALNCIVIIPSSLNDVILYDHKNYREINRISELDPIISANLSKNDDGQYLITNVSKVSASINLYDLSSFQLINKYYGHTQEQYVIECSFSGKNDEYIVCGSEDACIYIWHRSNSIAIHVISGHTGSINSCVLGFYKDIPFIISVSDDYTIRVWENEGIDFVYRDLTNVKSNRKISELYKENMNGESNGHNHNNIFTFNEYYNFIDDDNSSEERQVRSGEESD